MKALLAEQVAVLSRGRLLQGRADVVCRRVVTDSRKTGPGDLFVALAGERFDAHDFLAEVTQAGAAAVMVSRLPDGLVEWPGAVIEVGDTLAGLQALASGYRRLLDPLIIGITGSNGKTSTKDLLSAVLRKKFRVTATLGNLNNHIGVPLTLLSMDAEDEVGVVEMGMNHFGEIEALARIAEPDAAVVTNIGIAHIEYMGSREGIAQEKGMLVEAVPAGGVAILNATDDMTPSLAARCRGRVLSAGVGAGEVSASVLASDALGTRFSLSFPDGEMAEVQLPLVGRHMVGNATLAAAAGWHFGVKPALIAEALAEVRLTKGRLQVRQVGGVTFLDDSYNANPDSMKAGLKTLGELEVRGRRAAVLGRMGELGVHAASGHREVGEFAARSGLDLLLTVGGDEAALIGQSAGAVRADLRVQHVPTHAEGAAVLRDWVKEGDAVLLKGSRAAGMEQVLIHFVNS